MKPVKKADLGRTLAAQALAAAMAKKAMPMISITELARLIASERNTRLLGFFLRSQREASSRILAHALVANLTKQETDFVRGHYRDRRSIQNLAARLSVGERTLYGMHEQILSRLAALLRYRIRPEDSYSPRLSLNLLTVLDVRIQTFARRPDIPVAEGFLPSLLDARRRCRALFSLQTRLAGNPEESPLACIVAGKMLDPAAPIGALAGGVGMCEETAAALLARYAALCKGILDAPAS